MTTVKEKKAACGFTVLEAVFAKAREIAAALDAGTYSGPKNVSVIV